MTYLIIDENEDILEIVKLTKKEVESYEKLNPDHKVISILSKEQIEDTLKPLSFDDVEILSLNEFLDD